MKEACSDLSLSGDGRQSHLILLRYPTVRHIELDEIMDSRVMKGRPAFWSHESVLKENARGDDKRP
jgi:hypothetical protein